MCQVQRLMLSFRDRLVIDDVGKVSWFPEFLMEVPPPRNIRILRSWIDTRFNVTQATFTDMNCEQGYWIQLKTQSNITNFAVTQNWFIVMVLALAEAKTYSHMSFTSGWSTPSPAPPCNSPTTVFTLSVYHPAHKSSHLWQLKIYWPLGCSNTLNPSEASNQEDLF